MGDAIPRKDATSSMKESVKPEGAKSTTEQLTNTASETADKAAGSVQPSDDKGIGQKAFDSTRSGKDDAQNEGGSVLDSVSNSASSAAQSVQDTLSGATSGNK